MKHKIWLMVCVLVTMLLSLAGCSGSSQEPEGEVLELYYVSNTETSVVMHEYTATTTTIEGQIEEVMTSLSTVPTKVEYKPPLNLGFKLLDYDYEDGRICLNFDENYQTMSATTEVLARAAIVRSFSQIEGIRYVSFEVEGQALHDSLGKLVGMMTADQFIDNSGNEINAYERVKLKLYFSNADGTALIATNRTLAYNTNIPIEKLVVEQLVAGPGSEVADVAFPTIHPNSKIVSVTVRDGVCYVNFDETFLTQIYNVSTDVAIYSIVNSLVELPNVNKVQLSIDGETNVMYRETTSLSTVFERKLELVTTVD